MSTGPADGGKKYTNWHHLVQRGLFLAMGFSEVSYKRPWIAIANTWNELNPGHSHLRAVAEAVKRGVWQMGGTPLEFNTLAICDGMSLKKSYHLPVRDLIAFDTARLLQAHDFAGCVFISGCDKNVPGQLMAAAEANFPSIFITGGTMLPGHFRGEDIVCCTDGRRLFGEFEKGEMTSAEFDTLLDCTHPGVGACGTMGTANTMQAMAEALGMCLPGTASEPAGLGQALLVRRGSGPPDHASREGWNHRADHRQPEGGGERNRRSHGHGRLHQRHPAPHRDRAAGRRARGSGRVLRDQQPHTVSLRRQALRPFHRQGFRGRGWGSGGTEGAVRAAPPRRRHGDRQDARREPDRLAVDAGRGYPLPHGFALSPDGGIVALHGNLAPQGAIIKKSGVPRHLYRHRGPARVFDRYKDFEAMMHSGEVDFTPEHVIVIRNEGPRGGPGMQEILIPPNLCRYGLQGSVIITDGRTSGTQRGRLVVHTSPEAAAGGPIALVADGDMITLDIDGRSLSVELDEAEMATRWRHRRRPSRERGSLWLELYRKQALSAVEGAGIAVSSARGGHGMPRRSGRGKA